MTRLLAACSVLLRRQSHRGLRRSLFAAFASGLLLAQPAAAQIDNDIQLWTQVVTIAGSKTDWPVHLEIQPRWSGDADGLDQTIGRVALGRKLGRRVTAWGGYAGIARTATAPTTYEQRAWEQLSLALPSQGAWAPSIRVRVEQRFLDSWGDASHRLRVLGRLVRPLTTDGSWSLALWDEAMVTMDDTVRGPAQGVDQNRAIVSVMRRLSPRATAEAGYLWQASNRPGSGWRFGHTTLVWLNLTP